MQVRPTTAAMLGFKSPWQTAAEAERLRRQRALMQEFWAAHAARVRAIEAKVDRIMKGV